jgi:hypothetical protein
MLNSEKKNSRLHKDNKRTHVLTLVAMVTTTS